MLLWLEKLLVIKDDRVLVAADAAIGIGIDIALNKRFASPQSKAVASKCLDLYKSGHAQNILLTGAYTQGLIPITEAQAMCDVIAWQIPWENIFLDQDNSNTTLDNAVNTLAIAREEGWSNVIIIAQQLHARRVKATFKRQWRDSDINFMVVKAWSGYGGGTQYRLRSFLSFLIWDTLSFIYFKLKNFC